MARKNWTPTAAEKDRLAELALEADELREKEERISWIVFDLRHSYGDDAVPWRAIGHALGVTASAAQQRYGRK